MRNKMKAAVPRRRLLISAPIWLMGLNLPILADPHQSAAQTAPALPDQLTAAELEAIEKSALAGDLKNYFGRGNSCAESMLLIGLRYLKKPEDLVWVAAGFGGGMLHKETCGFLTAGLMNIGLAAGVLKMEKKEAKEWSKQRVNEFWDWWRALAPLRCADIRKEGVSSQVCRRIGLLAAAKIEDLIASPN